MIVVLLAVVLLVATLGEGGAEPTALLIWHGLLLAAVVVSRFLPTDRRLDPGFALCLGLFGLAVAAGVSVAPFAYGAWVLAIEVAAFCGMAWMAARLGPDAIPRVAPVLLAAAMLHGLLAIWQGFVEGEPRPAGTFLNTNHLAAWLGGVTILALVSADGRRGTWLVRGLISIPVGVAFLLTGSRGAMLGLVVALAFLAIERWGRLGARARMALILAAVTALGILGLRQYQRFQEPDRYAGHRVKIWKASLMPALERPWTGTGPRQFATAAHNLSFPDGRGPLRFDRSFSTTHSDLLRPVAELGWPTAAILLITVLYGIWRARRLGGDAPDPVRTATFAALLALATQAVVDNLSERPAVYLLVAFLCGALLSRRDERARPHVGWSAALAALLIAVFCVVDLNPYRAWRWQQQALVAGNAGDESLRRARLANPIHPDGFRIQAERLTATLGRDLSRYAEARQAAETAIRLDPQAPRHRRTAARVEVAACRQLFRDRASRERARDRFLEAEARSRYDPLIPLELAAFLLSTGDPIGARRATERALTLEPNGVRPRLLLAETLLAAEGPAAAERAEALVREAQELADRWARHADGGVYAERLLGFDEPAAARIRRQLAREEVDADL